MMKYYENLYEGALNLMPTVTFFKEDWLDKEK